MSPQRSHGQPERVLEPDHNEPEDSSGTAVGPSKAKLIEGCPAAMGLPSGTMPKDSTGVLR